MSIASTISRAGKTVQWRKMMGDGGDYDVTTGTVAVLATEVTDIKVVFDGFGSVESQLRGMFFGKGGLVQDGQLRAFTVAMLHPGDIITADGKDYTVVYVKSIWKKSSVVLNEALVQL